MFRLLTRYRAYLNSFIGLLIVLTVPIVALSLLPIAYTVFEHKAAIEFLTEPCALAVIAVSALMGSVRGWILHPVFDEDYWQWLARTPWRLGDPLPKGPLDLQWQDMLVVALLALINGLLALTIHPPVSHLILGPIAGYCFGITVAWSLAISLTGHGKYILLSLAVPLLFRLIGAPVQAFILCPVVMLLITRLGLRRSLADFPWTDILEQSNAKNDSKMIGWPTNILARHVPSFPLSIQSATLLAGLIGGWCWFISKLADSSADRTSDSAIHVLVVLATLYAVATRIAIFRSAICDHFCIGLRFGRKKWFIPKHDQILIAPLAMLILSIFLPLLLPALLSVSQAVSNGLTAGLVSLVGLAMGPRVSELYHTGEHSKFGGAISASDKSKSFLSVDGK